MKPLRQQTTRVLELTGVLDYNRTEYDGPYAENIEGPRIGDTHIIEAMNKAFPETGLGARDRTPLTILLAYGGAKELYVGEAWACEGDRGYSSWTPGESPDFFVGGSKEGGFQDFMEVLERLDGQTVHLRIDDGETPLEPTQIRFATPRV